MIESLPGAKYELIREMTARDNNQMNIVWLCEIAGVSRSGYYRWLAAEPSRQRREEQDKADFDLILEAAPTVHVAQGKLLGQFAAGKFFRAHERRTELFRMRHTRRCRAGFG